ncbi:MAG TPA: helix-turn-helix transcriptional regulator [Thermoanaerobaculia bacterium]|nr:helix-turn-helix transcriptional regulator [Thermoanaerobaculia bacterium]
MRYEERPAHPPLGAFVKCLWRLRGERGEVDLQPIVPDGGTELILHLGEPFLEHGAGVARQGRALLAATFTRPLSVAAAGDVDVVGVRFRPGGVYPFLTVAPVEVAELVVPAAEVVARELRAGIGRVEPGATSSLFLDLERALVSRLALAGHDADFDRRLGALLAGHGDLSISSLATSSGTSRRQLERQFKARVGVPPKVLQRVVRFHRAASRLLDGGVALADLAADLGFSDQAHMNREFRLLAETTPGRYPRQAGALDRLFAGH